MVSQLTLAKAIEASDFRARCWNELVMLTVVWPLSKNNQCAAFFPSGKIKPA